VSQEAGVRRFCRAHTASQINHIRQPVKQAVKPSAITLNAGRQAGRQLTALPESSAAWWIAPGGFPQVAPVGRKYPTSTQSTSSSGKL
jgi:hypothetical protein